jgi:hypothetical protein
LIVACPRGLTRLLPRSPASSYLLRTHFTALVVVDRACPYPLES